MNEIGAWTSAIVDHLGKHWQAHLLPAIAFFAATMIVTFGVMFVLVALMIVLAIAVEIIGGPAELLIGPIAFLLGFFGMLVPMLFIMPLFIGHVRMALLAHRGETPTNGELFWGYRRIVKVLVLMGIIGAVNIVAVLFCFFPSLIWAVVTLFAVPAMVDRDLGPVEALGASWELVKPRFVPLLVFMVLYFVVGMVLYYVPIVGPLLTFAVFVAMSVVLYDRFRGE
jgi:hypothetical protein